MTHLVVAALAFIAGAAFGLVLAAWLTARLSYTSPRKDPP